MEIDRNKINEHAKLIVSSHCEQRQLPIDEEELAAAMAAAIELFSNRVLGIAIVGSVE